MNYFLHFVKKTTMNKCILLIAAAGTTLFAQAQKPLSTSNCSVTLTVQGESGTNGVAVAYNPSSQTYYSVFAGNTSYPIETHTASGTSTSTQEIGHDVRGMWYNPSKKCLEGITYDNQGSFEVKLNPDGSIAGTTASNFSYGMGSQTVATYAEKKKSIMFVEGNTVYFFKPGKLSAKKVFLSPGTDLSLNTNGPIYTGVKNYEIGLVDAETMTVILFSEKTGHETARVKLNVSNCNGESLSEYPYSFRVSYCNGRVFIFDVDLRTWTGYKLF